MFGCVTVAPDDEIDFDFIFYAFSGYFDDDLTDRAEIYEESW